MNKPLNDLSHILLIILLILSLGWSVVSFSLEAVVAFFTAAAGIIASFRSLKEYRFWGRIALVVAVIVSLMWAINSPNWTSIATLLTSAISAISSFSDEESRDLFPVLKGRETSPGTISRILLTLSALGIWVLVWYVCLYWGFQSYIPGLLLDITVMAAPAPQGWLIDNTTGFLIWFVISGLVVVLPIDWREKDSVIAAGLWAGIISIITAWISYLVYVAHGWNLGDLFASLMVMILAHMLLVGFIASIGMALFGIGVTIIWTGIMMLVRWVVTVMQRLFV